MPMFDEQVPDVIILKNEPYKLYTLPFADWMESHGDCPTFQRRSPQCERGYIARWEVRGTALWLIGLYAWDLEGGEVGVPELFGGQREVPAEWYTGAIDFEPSMELVAMGIKPGIHRIWFKDGMVVRVPEQNRYGSPNPAQDASSDKE